MRDFVRGLIDGDGTIWIHKYSQEKNGKSYNYQYAAVGLISGSKSLLKGLMAELQKQFEPEALSLKIIKKESGGTALVEKTGVTYVLRIQNWSAYKFLKWLYYSPDLLCLNRKRKVAEHLFKIYSNRTDKDERDRLTKETIRLRKAGLSAGRIMQVLNITRNQAKNYTRSLKVVNAKERTYARKTAPVVVEEMRRLRLAGLSPGVIAKRLGVPKATVEDNIRPPDELPYVNVVVEEAPSILNPERMRFGSVFRDISRQGRKFGIGLTVISQQVTEIDHGVLTQLNTELTTSLGNEMERKEAIRNASGDLSGFERELQVLAKGQCIMSTSFRDIPVPLQVPIHSGSDEVQHGG